MKYVGAFIFLVLFSIIYYRKSILKGFFGTGQLAPALSSLLLAEAFAQDESPTKKKSL